MNVGILVPVGYQIGHPLEDDETELLAGDDAFGRRLERAVMDVGPGDFISERLDFGGDAERVRMIAGPVNPPHPKMRDLAQSALDRANFVGF